MEHDTFFDLTTKYLKQTAKEEEVMELNHYLKEEKY